MTFKLKMNVEHFQTIKKAFNDFDGDQGLPTIDFLLGKFFDNPEVKDSEVEVGWVVLYNRLGADWVATELRPYLEDEHIISAFRKILRSPSYC